MSKLKCIIQGIIRGYKDFRLGLKVLTGAKPFARGDKNLAMAAKLFQNLIPMGRAKGVGLVRQRAIKLIEGVLRERLKKNPLAKEEELLNPFLTTPDFMELLKVLDMGKKDLQFFAGEALKKGGKND